MHTSSIFVLVQVLFYSNFWF